MSIAKKIAVFVLGALVLTACASARIKARKDERDKVAATSHLYCDFVNGEVYPDVEVAMNIEMAKHCDAKGNLTITQYHSPSDATGLVYCCSTKDVSKELSLETPHVRSAPRESQRQTPAPPAALTPAKDTGKDIGEIDDTPTPAEKK